MANRRMFFLQQFYANEKHTPVKICLWKCFEVALGSQGDGQDHIIILISCMTMYESMRSHHDAPH